MQRMF